MNIFEVASRKKLRFASIKGDLTVEQVWDLPLSLESPTRDVKADLDTLARGINAELTNASQGSFVKKVKDKFSETLALKLEIVKYIIDVKQKEIEAREKNAENHKRRAKLYAALASAEEAEMMKKTPAEIRAELEKLDAELDAA